MRQIEINGSNYPLETPGERLDAMLAAISLEDTECGHVDADTIMVAAVRESEPALAELFEKMDKWYA